MFHSILRRIAPLTIAAAAAILTACSSEPTLAPQSAASAQVSALTPVARQNWISRQEGTVPFSFVVWAPCANGGEGEVLQANGELQYKGQWLTSQNDQRTHSNVISSFTGTATGWSTNDVYDVVTKEHVQGNITDGTDGILDSGEQLERIQLRLTNRATGAVMDIVLTGRFVQTATGEYVQSGFEGTARCR